jgi:elongator complex protein 2
LPFTIFGQIQNVIYGIIPILGFSPNWKNEISNSHFLPKQKAIYFSIEDSEIHPGEKLGMSTETVGIFAGCTPSRSTAVYRQDESGSIQVLYSSGKNIIFSSLDSTKGRKVYSCLPDIINSLSWNGDEIIAACNDSKIYILKDSDIIHTYTLSSAVHFLDRNQDFLLAGCIDGSLHLIKLFDEHIFIKLTERISSLKLLLLNDGIILALVGTSDSHLKIFHFIDKTLKLLLSLEGHTNWISCISIDSNSKLIATGSHDKSIRIWKLKHLDEISESNSLELAEFVPLKNQLKLGTNYNLCIELESVLLGHEDLIHSVYFDSHGRLLSSSGDGIIMLWEKGEDIWQTVFQVGQPAPSGGPISSDLYDAAIFPSDKHHVIVAHCSTGTFIQWIDSQPQPVIISGHIGPVEDISWSFDGSFLLSVSSDKTTRIFSSTTFQEISRPQIHGYEMKSIAFLRPDKIISAGDEKIIRVFKQSALFPQLLSDTPLGLGATKKVVLPALGLSNKEEEGGISLGNWVTEVDLCRDTLWPEIDKLYSHGDELFTLAISPDNKYFASAARASLTGDSAIRLWDVSSLSMLKSLSLHKLTVVQLAFSPDSTKLLSVSRDRTAIVYDIKSNQIMKTISAHSRIVWTCAWIDDETFLTGGRDEMLFFWKLDSQSEHPFYSIKLGHSITASCVVDKDRIIVGFDDGSVILLNPSSSKISSICLGSSPLASITKIVFNPVHSLLAISSKDHLIRLIKLHR